MTFILNLHGTTPVAQHFYQWGYFAAYKHVASHDLIIATPSSVVTQWGNGDNGADEPYLMHVIDWVYKTSALSSIFSRCGWVATLGARSTRLASTAARRSKTRSRA
jgi:hypothetical protein